MKKTEIATIIFVASLSMLATYFIANTVIGKQATMSTTVKVADKLPEAPRNIQLSKQFFNKDALNPTVEVFVDSDNSSTNSTSNALSSTKPTDADQSGADSTNVSDSQNSADTNKQ